MIAFRPAALTDIAALWPRLPHRAWRRLAVQVTNWPAWTVTIDGAPALVCGAAPVKGRRLTLELWLAVPASFARLPRRLAAIRFLLMRTALFAPDFTLIVRVNDANRNGRRMAASAGFVPTGETLDDTAFRSWARPPVRNLMTGNRTILPPA